MLYRISNSLFMKWYLLCRIVLPANAWWTQTNWTSLLLNPLIQDWHGFDRRRALVLCQGQQGPTSSSIVHWATLGRCVPLPPEPVQLEGTSSGFLQHFWTHHRTLMQYNKVPMFYNTTSTSNLLSQHINVLIVWDEWFFLDNIISAAKVRTLISLILDQLNKIWSYLKSRPHIKLENWENWSMLLCIHSKTRLKRIQCSVELDMLGLRYLHRHTLAFHLCIFSDVCNPAWRFS